MATAFYNISMGCNDDIISLFLSASIHHINCSIVFLWALSETTNSVIVFTHLMLSSGFDSAISVMKLKTLENWNFKRIKENWKPIVAKNRHADTHKHTRVRIRLHTFTWTNHNVVMRVLIMSSADPHHYFIKHVIAIIIYYHAGLIRWYARTFKIQHSTFNTYMSASTAQHSASMCLCTCFFLLLFITNVT